MGEDRPRRWQLCDVHRLALRRLQSQRAAYYRVDASDAVRLLAGPTRQRPAALEEAPMMSVDPAIILTIGVIALLSVVIMVTLTDHDRW